MRKVMITFALLSAGLMAYAQDDIYFNDRKATGETFIPLNDKGAYERQEVVTVEGASASSLYDLAMMALSEWTGPDGKAKVGIDYQNQETHTVVYKGSYSLGFKEVFLGDGWERQADFILKVRCKDGKAQVTLTVPTYTARFKSVVKTGSILELSNAVDKARGKKRSRGVALLEYLKKAADGIVDSMAESLKMTTEEDF